jgi:hypothetical protein
VTTTLVDSASNSVAILSRVLQRDEAEVLEGAAPSIIRLGFPKADLRRMNHLAAKARRDKLTAKERWEAEQYDLVSHLLAFLQAKARQAAQTPVHNADGQ